MGKLVSFSGYATAGKDAAADSLVKNQGFIKTFMSKPLATALLTLDPWIKFAGDTERYSDLHKRVGYDESKKNPEVRRLLQTLGTEIGRNMFYEDAWLDLVFKEIAELHQEDKDVCLTGVRYPNEIDRVRSAGGITIWIDRPGIEAVNTHSSEHTLAPWDCDIVVINSGTLDELSEKLNKIFPLSDETQHNQISNSDCVFVRGSALEGGRTYLFTCKTHNYAVFMPIDKAPEKCPLA